MNQGEFERGDLIYYENYEIWHPITQQLEYSGPRLLVVLSPDNPCLLLESTSQSKHFPNANPNCNPKLKVFLIKGDSENAIQKDTYVKVNSVRELPYNRLQKDLDNKIVFRQAPLGFTCFNLILSCLKHFKRDISIEHMERIFIKN